MTIHNFCFIIDNYGFIYIMQADRISQLVSVTEESRHKFTDRISQLVSVTEEGKHRCTLKIIIYSTLYYVSGGHSSASDDDQGATSSIHESASALGIISSEVDTDIISLIHL